ncbi:MAG: Jag N-terminal domain-containing protein [Elusimicrobia bacterium]|nr:Jag N-terminal domain-containing protein [Elusimicrobiota bacterium]
MRKEVEITGKTANAAIEKGLEELGLEKKDVEIKILDEGKSGLFGLMGSTPARIKMSVKDTARLSGKGRKSSNTASELPKNAAEILSEIFKLSGFKTKVAAEVTSMGSVLNVSSDDSAILIGRQGQTMRALEYIMRLILSKQEGKGVKVAINVNGYLDKKNEKIIQKAKELEKKVKEKGGPISIKLSASERKIIHMELQNSPYVETVSEGVGDDRKLIVRPK